jgi:hypothetical protein
MSSRSSLSFLLILIISSSLPFNPYVNAEPNSVQILDSTSYMLSGYYYVIGEVKNIGANPLEKIKITATFYDNKNNVLASTFGFATFTILIPEQKSPFKISSEPYLNLQVDHYILTITEFIESNYYPYNKLKIEGTTWGVEQGYQVLFGDVKNVGDRPATSVNVVATFYDHNGKIVSTNYAFATPDTIAVGESVRFKVNTAPQIIITEYWTLQAQCHETMIASHLICNPSSDYIVLSGSIQVTGSISPIINGANINLEYTRPNGTKVTRPSTTSSNGEFSDTLTPDVLGTWKVKATWSGNSMTYGGNSTESSFAVLSKAPSAITIGTHSASSYLNETRSFNGTLIPKIVGANITLTFEKPDGKQFLITNETDYNSKYFLNTHIFDLIGVWKVTASWGGNNLFQASSSSTIQFEITEPPTKGNVKITVQDSSGYPLAGAVIISTKEPSGQGKIGGISNVEGMVELNSILAGVYNFKITLSSYNDTSVNVNLNRGETTSTTVTLNELSSTLKIQVKTSDNQLLTSVNIVSTIYPPEQTQLTGLTDSNGNLVFTNIKKGTYAIKASKTGYQDKTITFDLGKAETLDKIIVLNASPKTDTGIPGNPMYSIFLGLMFCTFILITLKKKK